MAPSRRSQNPDLETPLQKTPRLRKPTQKVADKPTAAKPTASKPAAKQDPPVKRPFILRGPRKPRWTEEEVEQEDKDPEEFDLSPSITVQKEKDRRARYTIVKEAMSAMLNKSEAVNAEASRLKKAGKGKEAHRLFKKASGLRAEHAQRQRDAEERYTATLRREKDLWDAEVAQFGEIEAKRRYDEVAARRAADNELDTSEFEALEDEENQADPEINLTLIARVNGKVEITKKLSLIRTSKINFYNIKLTLDEELKKKDSDAKEWKITRYLASICPDKKRATLTLKTFNNFSETEWDRVLGAILSAVYNEGVSKAVIKIEISMDAPTKIAPKKRPI